ncbi:MAG: 16S rRNA (adenine(1518)-N(6)/adenine(1519)-N(6))-dimethyltransferase RsmA [Methanobrevibacter sp.]|jgi:16S rRNA (adenine1518-N6/adenine1519-N6)-dimethyltransferase|nr:16S rRNA (adenine(1518)-N(6)/adenine(1519)-N(6))-dimethyltransferase RsmA [Candidatus Methanovirga meridionalis]
MIIMSNISLFDETKNILKENNLSLKRSLGQNYLIDDFKRKKILNFAQLNKNDEVLEIGSGIGTLSLKIAEKVKKLIAIEQDTKIFNILSKRVKEIGFNNIELINKDALKVDFPKFNKIVSNLPYQISSPITFKLLKYDFDLAILTYQKEFAIRMIGKVNTKDYSRLTAMLHFKANIEFLDDLSPNSFFPQPKVQSSVIKLSPLFNEEFKRYEKEYSQISKAIFQHKNKKVMNSLIDSRIILGHNNKKEVHKFLDEISSDNEVNNLLNQRVIKTTPNDIFTLSKQLKSFLK